MPLEFVLSQKGKRLLLHDNHIYREHRRSKNVIHWRCCYYEKRDWKCCAKVHTNSDKKYGQVLECFKPDEDKHNHIVEKSEIDALIVKEKIKKFAGKSADNPISIVAKATANISNTTSAMLPINKSLCRTVQRERAKILGGPALPTDVFELIIPEMFKVTLRGENFLHHDYNDNVKRILIYTTDDNLNILKKCRVWQSDGTFDTVPLIFQQLYSIHGLYKDNLIPLVYVLTTDKSQSTYKHILQEICKLKSGLRPVTLIVDFESGFINAFQEIFPNCAIHGCYFHFCQCVWRCIQRVGLQSTYQNDDEFSFQIRNLLALAFPRTDDVTHFYELLLKSEYYTVNKDLISPILDYFSRTWVMRKGKRGKILSSRFPISLWNCHDLVLNEDPRTNNKIEGWHRGFSSKINRSHATIWKFLNTIQLEQSLTENKISDIRAKKIIKPNKNTVDIKRDERLFRIVTDYLDSETNEIDYLNSIALNVYLH